ncbi:hypothetical protein K6T82_02495 [Flavobacterium sp. 17A]|uniref:Uncharacterized protein n=1 Tax=Flavobacterium potami TaxID=2872310 RepID=A0A9X1H7M8_9FLAO|nr:hypothetical protein [Flavobacterium potami]MBZ4033617.1 hypothetical protein [Flavobacterium potami]
MTDNSSKKQDELVSNHKKVKSMNKKHLLYGMTQEQYREGLEIHTKCFEPVEKLTLQLICQTPAAS